MNCVLARFLKLIYYELIIHPMKEKSRESYPQEKA